MSTFKWVVVAIGAVMTIVAKGIIWEGFGLTIIIIAGMFHPKRRQFRRIT